MFPDFEDAYGGGVAIESAHDDEVEDVEGDEVEEVSITFKCLDPVPTYKGSFLDSKV